MTALLIVLAWMKAHWMLSAAGGYLVVTTIINRLPKAPTWLLVISDLLALVPRPGMIGVGGQKFVNMPLMMSKAPEAPKEIAGGEK